MSRYFRCQRETCRRKWHVASLAYERAKDGAPAARTDLFTAPTPKAAHATGCPGCGFALVPEKGCFEELFTEEAA